MEKKGKNTMSLVLSVLNLRWQCVSSVRSSSLIPNGIYSLYFRWETWVGSTDSSVYTVSLTVYTVEFNLGRDRDPSEDAGRGSRKERPKMELSASNIAETFQEEPLL